MSNVIIDFEYQPLTSTVTIDLSLQTFTFCINQIYYYNP
jgi:hypothetical protein